MESEIVLLFLQDSAIFTQRNRLNTIMLFFNINFNIISPYFRLGIPSGFVF